MFDRWDRWFLAGAAALFLAATLPWIGQLGVEHDEAHFYPWAAKIAFGSPERLRPPDGWYAAHRPIPFMTMPYVGGLDAWLYAAAFQAGGVNRVAPRVVNLGLGVLFLILAYVLARQLGSRAVAMSTVALLLIDLEFLLHVPPGFGPFLIQIVCGTGAAILLTREDTRPRHVLGAFALFGVALNEKLTFAWFGAALMLALLICYRRELLRHRGWLLAGAALTIVLAAPVIWYAYGRPEIVFGFGRSNARLPMDASAIQAKLEQWQLLMDGRFSLPWQLGREPDFARWSSMLPLFAISAILSLWIGRAARFAALISLGVWLANLPFPDAGRLHHLILMYPFPHLAIALAAQWIVLRIPRVRLGTAGVAAALFLTMAFSTVRHLIWYRAEVAASGGRQTWSSSTIELAHWAAERPDRHYVTASWGIDNVLTAFTRAEVVPEGFYFDLLADPPSPETAARLERALRREDTLWIFSNLQPQYEQIRAHVFARAADLGLTPTPVRQFRELAAYRFHPETGGIWQAGGPARRESATVIRLDAPGPFTRVAFTAEAAWDMESALVVELLDAAGTGIASFRRPLEYYPSRERRMQLEFGPNRYPRWWLIERTAPGELRGVRIAADGLRDPAGLRVSDIRFRP